MKRNHFYSGVNPTVDLIVINPSHEVLLIKRSIESNACPGMLAFPGGFIDSRAPKGALWEAGLETPKIAALRELAEETNYRDPRDSELSWTKTYAFLYQIDSELYEKNRDRIKGMDDADEAMWISLSDLRKMKLAFDHNIILEDAVKLLG